MSRPLVPYLKVLARSKIVWMHGSEIGLVMENHEVALWPYKSSDFAELCLTLTHEVVHRVHLRIDDEDQINRIADCLMRRARWVAEVRAKMGAALFEGVIEMKDQKAHELG